MEQIPTEHCDLFLPISDYRPQGRAGSLLLSRTGQGRAPLVYQGLPLPLGCGFLIAPLQPPSEFTAATILDATKAKVP